MKKLLTSMLIIMVLFQTVLSPKTIFAAEVAEGQAEESSDSVPDPTPEDIEDLLHNGTGTKGDKEDITINRDLGENNLYDQDSNTMKSIVTLLFGILNFIPMSISTIASIAITDFVVPEKEVPNFLTIEDLVFGRISMLDINFLSNQNMGTTQNGVEVNAAIKENVAAWYYAVRNIAIVLSLIILLYVGIRMAISTVASEKAKYKEMLKDWFISFVLLFTLQYIISAIFLFYSLCIQVTANLYSNGGGFEQQIINKIVIDIDQEIGMNVIFSSITYWILVFYQMRFLLLYIKRFIVTGFLIAIAPAITVTYTIDRMADKRAQAFETWKRELIINILIQPLHILIYSVFVVAAGAIAEAAPILAILFFVALSRVEKIVKSVFKMRGAKSIHSMSETLKIGK